MYRHVLSSILALYCAIGISQPRLEVTDDIKAIYEEISELHLKQAQSQIDLSREKDPNNVMLDHMEHYIDFFTVFITEDDAYFKEIEGKLDDRIRRVKNTPPDSPYRLFVQAEMELMWALIRMKWDQKLRAGSAVLRAYKLLRENVERYPSFAENNKSLSIIHAISESLPAWLRTLVGIRGSIAQGTEEILTFVEQAEAGQSIWYKEGVVVATYLLFYLNNEQSAAWDLLNEHDLNISSHPLLTFIYCNMAQKTGQNDLAIDMLEARSRDSLQLDFHYLDLLLGKYKLYRLDADADHYILRYIELFEGQHFIKEAYQKLAWHALVVSDDKDLYRQYLNKCVIYGEDLTDEDKQALKEAKHGEIPDSRLLRIRLLYDGGYLARAHQELILSQSHYPPGHVAREQYLYRQGRVLQGLQNYVEAINYLSVLLQEYPKSDSYYACNAALQIGMMLEDQERYTEALRYYHQSLNIDASTYRTSLHQKAKAGIERSRTKAIR